MGDQKVFYKMAAFKRLWIRSYKPWPVRDLHVRSLDFPVDFPRSFFRDFPVFPDEGSVG